MLAVFYLFTSRSLWVCSSSSFSSTSSSSSSTNLKFINNTSQKNFAVNCPRSFTTKQNLCFFDTKRAFLTWMLIYLPYTWLDLQRNSRTLGWCSIYSTALFSTKHCYINQHLLLQFFLSSLFLMVSSHNPSLGCKTVCQLWETWLPCLFIYFYLQLVSNLL